MSKLNANSVELGSLTTAQRDALTSVAAGTIIHNSTTKTLQQWNGSIWTETNPPGTIITVAASTAPSGFLKANGAAVSRSTYSALFSYIGTTFGTGDGSTTFNLPDLRGQFIRGWADDGSTDSGRAFGSSQSATQIWNGIDVYYGVGGVRSNGESADGSDRAGAGHAYAGSSAYTSATGSTGVRPINRALLHCIKF